VNLAKLFKEIILRDIIKGFIYEEVPDFVRQRCRDRFI
jgi:hypothetical protein